MRTLYGLSQSPWTEKARWALDHHSVTYRYHEHVPLLGEVLLRMKARGRAPGTKASVPLLVDGDTSFCSSLAIAQHAEGLGRGEPLFPEGADAEVLRWADLSDRIIEVGRMHVLERLRSSREAQRESLPSFIPGPLRAVLAPMAATAATFLGSKYAVSRDAAAATETILRPALDEIEKALGERPYLLGRFTFADIAIAASLQAVLPRKRAALGPATRALWANEAIAREHEGLLAWRDELYTLHRPGA